MGALAEVGTYYITIMPDMSKFTGGVNSAIGGLGTNATGTMNRSFMDVLKPLIASIIDTVCFDGNGYTDAWKKEAKRRGLDTEICVPRMFDEFTKPASVEMFTKTGVYTEAELVARNEVKWETYTKKVQIEARVMGRRLRLV